MTVLGMCNILYSTEHERQSPSFMVTKVRLDVEEVMIYI